MNDKKNIERFFQEKFKDYEVNPEQQSWTNISKKLNQKKTKKPFFTLWLLVGGIAAGIIIGLFIYTNIAAENKIENVIEIKSVVNNAQNNNDSLLKNIKTDKKTENSVAANDNNSEVIINESNNCKKEEDFTRNTAVETRTATSTNTNKLEINPIHKKIAADKIILSKNESSKTKIIAEAAVNNKNGNKTDKKNAAVGVAISINKNNVVDATKNTANKVAVFNNQKNINKFGQNSEKFIATVNKSEIADSNIEKAKIDSNTDSKSNENLNEKILNSSNNDAYKSSNENISKNNSNGLKVAIDDNLIQKTVLTDTLQKPILLENSLNKIATEKDKTLKKKNLAAESSRWKIRPNIAPIYMNASKGSPIHDIFADNEKTYENKFSYGIGADYAITKKLSVRAGIQKFDLAYNTNNVAYYSDLTALNGNSPDNSIQTINLKDEFHNIVIGDRKARAAVVTPPNQTTEETGYLNQKFGYIEIPLEVSYKILDSRFGVTVISGFSTLLLNNNEVSIVSSNKTIVLGDVNNLSKTHYSTNFGIGFKYNFMKSFEINVEPTVKYQINSFEKDSGGFNPYFLGIYSGISYKL